MGLFIVTTSTTWVYKVVSHTIWVMKSIVLLKKDTVSHGGLNLIVYILNKYKPSYNMLDLVLHY